MKTTWRTQLQKLCQNTGDSLLDIQFECEDLDLLLDSEFDCGFGAAEGEPFVAWSQNWVYFSRDYDGADYIDCVPRNPKGDVK